MTLPGLGPKRSTADSVRVKALVEPLVDDDLTILVTELACTEPGCPPIETVIALFGVERSVQHKIHKPMAEVDRNDVVAALGGATTSAPHQH